MIAYEKSIKYLGVVMDKELRWGLHQATVIEKAKRAIMVCSRMAKGSWGCKPKIMLWMYNMMVKPIITYGAVVWSERTKLCCGKKDLEKIQRLACLCITGAMRTCPTAGMEALLGLAPLHRVVCQRATESKLRIHVQRHATQTRLTWADQAAITKSNGLTDMPSDNMLRKWSTKKNFKIHSSNKASFTSEADYNIKTRAVKWYTDGSRTSDGTGAGLTGPQQSISISMGHYPGIFQAELLAIDKCAQINLDRGYENVDIAIMSDSQAALKALEGTQIRSKLVWECLTKLNDLGSKNRVDLYWIPGHTGIIGNEKADELAKQGATTPLTGPEPFCGISLNDLKQESRRRDRISMCREWAKLPGLKHSKITMGGYNPKRTTELMLLNRDKVRVVTGFLTGHCRLGKHLRQLGIAEEGVCRFCGDGAETPIHLLQDCVAIIPQRWKHLRAISPTAAQLQTLKLDQVLDFLQELKLMGTL